MLPRSSLVVMMTWLGSYSHRMLKDVEYEEAKSSKLIYRKNGGPGTVCVVGSLLSPVCGLYLASVCDMHVRVSGREGKAALATASSVSCEGISPQRCKTNRGSGLESWKGLRSMCSTSLFRLENREKASRSIVDGGEVSEEPPDERTSLGWDDSTISTSRN